MIYRCGSRVPNYINLTRDDRCLSQDDEPAQEEVEQADGVHCELFTILRNHLLDKMYAAIGGPHECKSYVADSDKDMTIAANKHVDDCGQS